MDICLHNMEITHLPFVSASAVLLARHRHLPSHAGYGVLKLSLSPVSFLFAVERDVHSIQAVHHQFYVVIAPYIHLSTPPLTFSLLSSTCFS